MKTALVILAIAISASAQTNLGTIAFTNKSGDTISAEVVKVEVARIVYKTGDLDFGSAYFTNLPPDIRERFHYNPAAERIAALDEAEKRAERREAEEKKAMEAWIASQPKEVPITETIDVIEGSYKVTEQNDVWWRFSYKIKLRNNSSSNLKKFLRLQFVDRAGYELENTLEEINIGGLETKTITGSSLIQTGKADRVANFRSHWDD